MGKWICFLRSSAEKRAPKSEFKAKLAAEIDMRVAIHARNIGGCPKTVKTRMKGAVSLTRLTKTPRCLRPFCRACAGREEFQIFAFGPIRKTMEEWSIV